MTTQDILLFISEKTLKSGNPNMKSHKFIDVTWNTEMLNVLVSKRVLRSLSAARKEKSVFYKITITMC